MKRTLLVTLEYPPQVGGVSNYYAHLVEQLPEIQVLDNSKGQLLSLSRLVWPKWLRGLRSVAKAIRTNQIEHLLVGQILPIGTIALMMKRLFGTTYTVMTHAMDVQLPFMSSGPGSARKRRLVKRILAGADSVTTVSAFTRDRLLELGVPAEKIMLVYPCPHIDGVKEKCRAVAEQAVKHLLSERGLSAELPLVLSVSRLVKRKGIDMVIAALKQIEDLEWLYVIVGDGPDRARLQQLVENEGLQDRIHFMGKVEDAELATWFAAATVFAMPSRALKNGDVEGFGIVYVEANSFGVPVIGGDSGGVSDAVVDGKTGFLVEPTNVNMIASAIEQVITDPELARKMGEYGRQRVAEEFQWPVQAKRLEQLLQKR